MIRKQTAEEQIATMRHLIDFGKNVNEEKQSKPIVEFKRKAANGKTYGIIRESTKYYIMEAPQKNTEVLAEDFDYIGGFNNRKENEYSSYAKASNALDLKIMSINEAASKQNKVIIEQPTVKAEWEDKITESMRNEINRFKTITENVSKIMKEDKGHGEIPSEHTLPEAPAKNPSDEKVNAPFTQSGVAEGEKDFKKEEHNHETAGTPYENDAKASVEKNMQSDKKPVVKTDAEYLTNEKTYEPKNNVASEHPSGGKVVKVNENKGKKIRLKLTEEQVLTWNDNKNYMDMSNGTHVGSSEPYEDELGQDSNQTEADTDPIISEGNGDSVVYDHPNDQNSPKPGTTDVETEDGDPYTNVVNEEVEGDDIAGIEGEMDDDELDDNDIDVDLPDDNWDDDTEFEIEPDEDDMDKAAIRNARMSRGDEFTVDRANRDIQSLLNHEDDDYYGGGYDDFGDMYESRSRARRARRSRLSEDKLNVFGKHPAWRKQPMTTPPNKEVAINGAREWDDESAQGEQPYAEKIGDSAPFTQIVDQVMESVVRQMFNGKKKV